MKAYDVVVIVPLSEEFDYVKNVFEVTQTFVQDKITYYELKPKEAGPSFPDMDIVATVLNEMGNTNAAQKTERVLKSIEPPGPELVALVGIAGRLDDDLRLGDVVVADQVTNYEVRSKVADADQPPRSNSSGASSNGNHRSVPDRNDADSSGESTGSDEYEPPWTLIDWRPGGHTRRPAIELTEAFSEFRNGGAAYTQWQNHVQSHINQLVETQLTDSQREEDLTEAYYNPPPEAHKRHVASGGLIVTSTEFSKQLESHNRNMAAVEMEAAGVLLAVKRTDGVNSIILRGISDYADTEKSSLDTMGGGLWRQCATYAAASCLAHFLSGGYLETVVAESPATQQAVSTTERTPSSHESPTGDLSVLDVHIEGQGPGTNFLREHRIGSTVSSLTSQDRGFSVTTEFEISVSTPLQLKSIDIDTDTEARSEVLDHRILVDGANQDTSEGTHTYLDDPPVLSTEEPVTIRLEKKHRLEKPDSVDLESESSFPVTLAVQFETSEDSVAYEYRGRIDQNEGLVGLSKVSKSH